MRITAPTIAIVRYCRLRYALAPIWTAPEISCIRALPASAASTLRLVTTP